MVLSVLLGTLISTKGGVIRVKELALPLQPTYLPGHPTQQGCPLGQGQGLEGWCAFSPAGGTRPENWQVNGLRVSLGQAWLQGKMCQGKAPRVP